MDSRKLQTHQLLKSNGNFKYFLVGIMYNSAINVYSHDITCMISKERTRDAEVQEDPLAFGGTSSMAKWQPSSIVQNIVLAL